MLKLLFVSLVLVSIAFILIGFNIFFLKKKFPETSVGHNKNMKAKGIKCARCEELSNHKNNRKKTEINYKEMKMAMN
ncbi:MAG: hypothetical protein JXB00_03665 [Bacteroidales bacterium]|nr:hypothetical protein [Bacteroidales bacterium]